MNINNDVLSKDMLVIFSLFTLIYGNLTVSVIGKKNIKFVENNPYVIYLFIFIYSVFFTSLSYVGSIEKNIFKILSLSTLLYIVILLLIHAHPLVTISIMTIILVEYMYVSNKNENISYKYIYKKMKI